MSSGIDSGLHGDEIRILRNSPLDRGAEPISPIVCRRRRQGRRSRGKRDTKHKRHVKTPSFRPEGSGPCQKLERESLRGAAGACRNGGRRAATRIGGAKTRNRPGARASKKQS